MGGLRWEYKAAAGMAGLGLILLIVLFGEWLYGQYDRDRIMQQINRVQQTDFQIDPLPEYVFFKHPVQYYDEMINRPLFNKKRRPVKTQHNDVADRETQVIQPNRPFDLKLIGSLVVPGQGPVAVFQNPMASKNKDRFKRLQLGENYFDWRIDKILPDKVIVISGKQKKEILLRKKRPDNELGQNRRCEKLAG